MPSKRRSASQEAAKKIASVRRMVVAMATKGERITVIEIARRTLVSKSFIYRHPEIKDLIEKAQLNPSLVVAATEPHGGPPPDLAAITQRFELIGAESKRLFAEQRAKVGEIVAAAEDFFELSDRVEAVRLDYQEHIVAIMRLIASDESDESDESDR